MAWPVKHGTNLTTREVLALEEAGFQLQQRGGLSPCRKFQVSMDMPLSRFHFPAPQNPNSYDKYRHGYAIRRSMEPPLIEQ